jgi:dTDP-4-dehydrorhamnose 3,5-epimerase
MEFDPTAIPDVVLIRPNVFGDPRGYFFESWEQQKFAAGGITATFVQDNQSRSARHILRGLHYQIEQPQGKLVRVVTGTVYDVAVDLRRSSSTFGRWVGAVLSEANHSMLWVPPGFAHGFIVLSEYADFVYRCTDFWAPAHERSILWNDPDLNVTWPIPSGVHPLVSAKDAAAQRFRQAECFP